MTNKENLSKIKISTNLKKNFGGLALIYFKHGLMEIEEQRIDSGCFYITNAYALALEAGLKSSSKMYEILKLYKREE